MRTVWADFDTELDEFNGDAEHVHLLVNFPPKVTLSKLRRARIGRNHGRT